MHGLGQDRAEGFGRYTQADGSCYEGSPATGRPRWHGWVHEIQQDSEGGIMVVNNEKNTAEDSRDTRLKGNTTI